MRLVNRSALIVRPKEPYIQWALHLNEQTASCEASLRRQFSVYLVPPDPGLRREAAPLSGYYKRIFELELDAWITDSAAWPPVRDLKTFKSWLQVEALSLVIDLDDTELLVEDDGED